MGGVHAIRAAATLSLFEFEVFTQESLQLSSISFSQLVLPRLDLFSLFCSSASVIPRLISLLGSLRFSSSRLIFHVSV